MAAGLSGCSQNMNVPADSANFQLFVDVTPKEAIIIVDDVAMSSGLHTAEMPLKIQAGTRRIAIVCEGYHTFRTTLEYIQPGDTYTLKTKLIAAEF